MTHRELSPWDGRGGGDKREDYFQLTTYSVSLAAGRIPLEKQFIAPYHRVAARNAKSPLFGVEI